MPKLSTVYFPELEYTNDSIFDFPVGIPGFEDQIAFLFVEQPATRPLVFMQSLLNARLCFLAVPVLTVDPQYRLNLSSEDRATLGLDAEGPLQIGRDIACFVLLTVSEDTSPTVNMMSPIVINLRSRKGVQAIPTASEYSLRHPLVPEKETVPCS
ncbi:MAG TPA: flagellar assembly protein FliW [Bryobacteraceae bacterium]|nr:flagellar assembly protein FliW [Bryobacteraceae bacterium]